MTDVDRLFADYIEEHRAGGRADPLEYLVHVEGADRAELEALIDGYLARAPRQRWDPAAYRGSSAERLVESLAASFGGSAGLWPELLPKLRNTAQVKRSELVSRLAAALGVADREQKVAEYYNAMEHGQLPAAGVSRRVLEALGEIVGKSAEALRQAGQALGDASSGEREAAVFARTTRTEADLALEMPREPGSEVPSPPPEDWDEVDRLFRGGD